MTTAMTVPALVAVGGCPEGFEDCHHPGLPHISDCTGGPPWCHASGADTGYRCTLPALHAGPHLAGNGDWLIASWEPDPEHDWEWWSPEMGAATRDLPVLSWAHAEGAGGYLTSGGFEWSPPHERGLMPAAALAAYQREVADTDVPARVRLSLMPVPAQIAQWASDPDPAVRDRVTKWVESHLDDVEVPHSALHETIYTPGDPEPEVEVTVQKQYTNARGYDVDAAGPETHNANCALRALPRSAVAALRANDQTSDDLAQANGWLRGHRGGFYAYFEGHGSDRDGLPESVARWLAWADRWRHLLADP